MERIWKSWPGRARITLTGSFFMPRQMWLQYLEEMGQELNYTNFKARALPAGDYGRSDAYHRVWGVMRNWQDQDG